ncbi:hypothetical protein GCM10007907_04500 [Chitinimonas prasina]|uniref:Flagellar basal-body/hook protein C-terminal domain-containing protein n=1 Tax=Chitinimonas prasina TaxID=1434937 RepID=A0ABQ5Y9N8_9NEIS|nr:flagellar basal body rod C-terminal domain-containing protein [Chitinimonas prasina]GLR11660.1 hypothetical protein GCM10007907_04500 [Chitinimonas prasina]
MSVSALGAGLSGMLGYQRALDVSAHNVANTLTSGFRARQPDFSEGTPPGSGVRVAPSASSSEGTQIETEMVGQLIYKAGFQASAKVVSTADQMLGALIDIKA